MVKYASCFKGTKIGVILKYTYPYYLIKFPDTMALVHKSQVVEK